MLHEIQLFSNSSLYPSTIDSRTPAQKNHFQKQTWYLISKRRAKYSDRFHKNMLSRNDVTDEKEKKNRFKSALAEGCLVDARP